MDRRRIQRLSKTTLWALCLFSIFVQLALSIQTFRFCGHGHSLPQSNHLLLLPAAPNYELCFLPWVIESLFCWISEKKLPIYVHSLEHCCKLVPMRQLELQQVRKCAKRTPRNAASKGVRRCMSSIPSRQGKHF